MDVVEVMELVKANQIVLGIFVGIWVIKEVVSWLMPLIQKKNNKAKATTVGIPSDVDIRLVSHRVADLHNWHDKTDQDGVRIWYVRASFYKAIEKMTETTTAIATALRELVKQNVALSARLDSLEKRFPK